ncbi:MAG TPA: hypothetical protein VF828_01345 [Patescibacteria group bacterium]
MKKALARGFSTIVVYSLIMVLLVVILPALFPNLKTCTSSEFLGSSCDSVFITFALIPSLAGIYLINLLPSLQFTAPLSLQLFSFLHPAVTGYGYSIAVSGFLASIIFYFIVIALLTYIVRKIRLLMTYKTVFVSKRR